MTCINEYRDDSAKLTGEGALAFLFRTSERTPPGHDSREIEGCVRGPAGSEFILVFDMCFARRESRLLKG